MTRFAAILVAAVTFIASASSSAQALSDRARAFARGRHATAAQTVMPRAERGEATAQTRLGFMYEHGHGVAQDYGLAAYWYLLAAGQGHAIAQYLLGLLYDKGHGVERSDTLAYMWLNLAAAHAPPQAKEYYLRIRDAVAAKLSPAQIARAQWQASAIAPAHFK